MREEREQESADCVQNPSIPSVPHLSFAFVLFIEICLAAIFFCHIRFIATNIKVDNMASASLRSLKIKTSSCKRVMKELDSYEKEVQREAAKTADMKDKGADPYDLKQQENVLAESRMMIPDCRKRLEAALADLKSSLAELVEELNHNEGPEIEEAKTTIEQVENLFHTIQQSV